MSKYCRNCGYEMKDDHNVCINCGTKADTVVTSTAPTTPTGSNGIAIGGFVCALLGLNIIGLILSIIGISNAKKCDGKNKGLAIAGVIIAAIRIVMTIIAIIIFFLALIPSTIDSIEDTIDDEWENIEEKYEDTTKQINTNLPDYKDGKVVVYMFVGDGCPHCEEAKEWFESIKGQYGNKFVIEEYETWYNEENAELMSEIATKRGEIFKATGVPYIIIGKKSWVGFNQGNYSQEIIKQIEEQYNKNQDI